MRTVVLASVRTHARRYVAAVVAILAGVSFVLITASIGSATKDGLLSGLRASYPGARVVVQDVDGPALDRTLDAVRRLGPTRVIASGAAPLTVRGTRSQDETSVAAITTAASLRPERLASGRFPAGSGQALVAADEAEERGLRVGDTVTVGNRRQVSVRVVGLVRTTTDDQSAVRLTFPDLQRLGDSAYVDSLVVGGDATAAQVAAVVPAQVTVSSIDDYLQAEAEELTRGVDAISAVLLGFAAIALFVSVLVIANTFSVLLAQRQRELALLRCVGASKRQVRRSVRLEALAVGVGASTLALAVGTGLGHLVVAVVHAVAPKAPLGAAHVGLGWLVTGWLIGVIVTLVASVVPSRRTTRIEPLAALRPLGAVEAGSAGGATRIILFIHFCLIFFMISHARNPLL